MKLTLAVWLRIAAVALIVIALIAAARTTLDVFGVSWTVWLCGAILAVFVERLIEKL